MKILFCSLFALALLLSAPKAALSETVAEADFSTYVNGPLVGQNGWLRYGTVESEPIQVSGGTVGWVGGRTVSNEDVVLPFASQIVQPLTGSTVLNFDVLLSVSSAGSNPSYFAALSTRPDGDTSGNFANARLVARSADGGGFQFGARVNGQGGYPFAFGTGVLNFDQAYALRAEINMVSGNENDFINLFVGPDFENLTPYATAQYGSGTVSDPSFGGIILSQFGSGSVSEAGVTIQSISVTAVPEPASVALIAVVGSVALAVRRRRKSHVGPAC